MSNSKNILRFSAPTVSCTEAIDWEIVRVTFDTMPEDFDEEDRSSTFLSLSANFEFDRSVQIEFHDGLDYNGDFLDKVQLSKTRVWVLSRRGLHFEIDIDLEQQSFVELRKYLRVLLGRDVFLSE